MSVLERERAGLTLTLVHLMSLYDDYFLTRVGDLFVLSNKGCAFSFQGHSLFVSSSHSLVINIISVLLTPMTSPPMCWFYGLINFVHARDMGGDEAGAAGRVAVGKFHTDTFHRCSRMAVSTTAPV